MAKIELFCKLFLWSVFLFYFVIMAIFMCMAFIFSYCVGQEIRPETWNGCPEPYLMNSSEISFCRCSCHSHSSNGEPLKRVSASFLYSGTNLIFRKSIQISENDNQTYRNHTPDDLILQNISINGISNLKPVTLGTGVLFLRSTALWQFIVHGRHRSGQIFVLYLFLLHHLNYVNS